MEAHAALKLEERRHARPNYIIAAWGVLGFAALLFHALLRLTPIALAPIRDGSLGLGHAAVYLVWVGFMAYSEGYKAFHLQVSPRVVARALHLGRHPHWLHVLLAPAFCMALFHTTRRRLMTSWIVLLGIVLLVIGVRFLAQPWRGIVDGGVVVGLGWGLAALLWFFGRALFGDEMPVSAELPEPVP